MGTSFCMAANKQDCTLSHKKHHGLQGTQQDGGFLLRYGHLILYGSKQTGLHPFSQKASRSPRHTARWRLSAAIWAPHFVWQQTNRTATLLTKSITVSKAHSKMAAFCCDMGTPPSAASAPAQVITTAATLMAEHNALRNHQKRLKCC